MTKELFEKLGIEPEIKCPDCNCGLELNRVITADQVLQLEELILNSVKSYEVNKYENSYQIGIGGGEYCYKYAGHEQTRTQALCALLIKLLDSGVLLAEDVKEVLSR